MKIIVCLFKIKSQNFLIKNFKKNLTFLENSKVLLVRDSFYKVFIFVVAMSVLYNNLNLLKYSMNSILQNWGIHQRNL